MVALSIDDQNELFRNSIHSIVILVLQSSCSYLNYFNCEDGFLQRFSRIFPIFMRTCDYMHRIRDTFLNFKLDDVEYALFSMLVLMSPGKWYCLHVNRFFKNIK